MHTPDPVVERPDFEKAVLDELVYEKMRGSLDLCALVGFQVELSASVERVLQARKDRIQVEDRADIVMECFHRAWQRLSEEVLSELSAHELMAPESQSGLDPPRTR
jgi:hypothetical protein